MFPFQVEDFAHRAPVNRSSRSAAAACSLIAVWRFSFGTCLTFFDGSIFHGMPIVSASRIAMPSRSSSSNESSRSRCPQCTVDAARRIEAFWHEPIFPANVNIEPSTARTRFA